jgi:two-component system response regulator RegA
MSMRHCLVVDDDADFRAVLSTSLTRRGYRVSTAADTASALALAVEDRPDDVVLDLRLGEDSGLEVVAPLVALYPTVRIVVLTGFASIATAVQAIKLGAVHYLTKPADADEIVAAFARQAGDASVEVASRPTPLEHLEWEHIQNTLLACDGNISVAAKRLGLHRRTLQRKLQKRPSGLG